MSKIYFTSDWDKLYVYIFGSYTPEPWPGKQLVKNSDSGMYEMDVTGYENENLVIHDSGSNQLVDKTVSSLINKILDTTSGSIVDYNADVQESKKIVTVKNLEKFLEKTDIRYASDVHTHTKSDITDFPSIPTKVSDLDNDSGFLTEHQDISGKANKATTLSGYGITNAYTKDQVDKKISDLVNSAPETLDTLNELASALGNDPNFATTIAGQIGSKADDTDVVHKSGAEEIAGTKTFTGTIVNRNSTQKLKMENTYIDYDVPLTATRTSTIEFYDKNQKDLARLVLQRDTNGRNSFGLATYNQSESGEGLSRKVALYLDKENNSYFSANVNNQISLGISSYKWSDVQTVLLNGKEPAYKNDIPTIPEIPDISGKADKDNVYTKAETNNLLDNKANSVDLNSHTSNNTIHVTSAEKTKWNAKQDALTTQQLSNIDDVINKANDSDVVHNSGNESIAGAKTFTNVSLNQTASKPYFNIKSTSADIDTNPSSNVIYGLRYYDKNDQVLSYAAHDQLTNGNNALIFQVYNKPLVSDSNPTPSSSSKRIGYYVDRDFNAYFAPSVSKASDLGSTQYLWGNVYAENYNGTTYYGTNIGTAATPFDKVYSSKIGSSATPVVNLYATAIGSTGAPVTDLYVTNFHGSIDSATKASQNASGNELSNTIIKGLSISGTTITYTNLDGSTGTLTTQDTNTTYSSMSASEATTGTATTARSISAKVLNDKIASMLPTKVSDLDNDSNFITSLDFDITEAQIAAIVV